MSSRVALVLALAVSSVSALELSCTAESPWTECKIFNKNEGSYPTSCTFQISDYNLTGKDCQQFGDSYVCVKNCMDFENTEFTGNYSVHECAVRIENREASNEVSEKETDNWTCKMKVHAEGGWLNFNVTTTSGNGDKVEKGDASSGAPEQIGDGERQGSEEAEATKEGEGNDNGDKVEK